MSYNFIRATEQDNCQLQSASGRKVIPVQQLSPSVAVIDQCQEMPCSDVLVDAVQDDHQPQSATAENGRTQSNKVVNWYCATPCPEVLGVAEQDHHQLISAEAHGEQDQHECAVTDGSWET